MATKDFSDVLCQDEPRTVRHHVTGAITSKKAAEKSEESSSVLFLLLTACSFRRNDAVALPVGPQRGPESRFLNKPYVLLTVKALRPVDTVKLCEVTSGHF